MLKKIKISIRRKVIISRNIQTFLLLILCCFGFVVINNISSNIIDGVDNNYGIDCDELRYVIQKNRTRGVDSKYVDITYNNIVNIFDKDKPNDKNAKQEFNIKMRPMLNCLDPDEMYIEEVLKRDYLVPPARRDENYVLENVQLLDMKNKDEGQQVLDVMEMVYKNNLRGGFFVEAGAADCEFSVSLPLEHNYNWTGVLIEANPLFFKRCLKKKRKAYLLNHCLGTQKRAHFTRFNFISTGKTGKTGKNKSNKLAMGGFSGDGDSEKQMGYVYPVQCFNLESILYAAGHPTVNLFILDIEGWELAVLRSINWETVDIEVLSVETDLAGQMMKDSSPQIIIDFLKDKGYTRFKHREGDYLKHNQPQNDMFVRNDIVKKYNVVQLL